jgi:hypothetical protein
MQAIQAESATLTSAVESLRLEIKKEGEQKFTVTADSFINLVKRTYETMSSADKEFNRHVSLSMYQYYIVIHFWARLAAISPSVG